MIIFVNFFVTNGAVYSRIVTRAVILLYANFAYASIFPLIKIIMLKIDICLSLVFLHIFEL